SRRKRPKPLLPLAEGQSLLRLAWDRLEGLIPRENRFVAAPEALEDPIRRELGLPAGQFIGEPQGRDTLNALGLALGLLHRRDPEGITGVFSADHIMLPRQAFLSTLRRGYEIAAAGKNTLLCFGVPPTEASPAFGYLELGESLKTGEVGARRVVSFREKPPRRVAEEFFREGPDRFLWNAGVFVFKNSVFLRALKKHVPENAGPLEQIVRAWDAPVPEAPPGRFPDNCRTLFAGLKKISVDYGIMEPASRDKDFEVAALPLTLDWRDIGSWPACAGLWPEDPQGNHSGPGRILFKDCRGSFAFSEDPRHLIAALGCDDLIIVHTPQATLVCPWNEAQGVKDLPALAEAQFGEEFL
ncbi:MAG: hypothetical protein LBQ61_10385, partial [Spirochaetales bacterium]|nr:hypothetical protein [Spirochaetales bacterium]